MIKLILSISLLIILTSCFQEDEIIKKHSSGNTVSSTIELTETYKYQAYFDLGTNTVVATNLKTDWDLGFECSDTGYLIILNTSKFMKAYNTGLTDLNTSFDTTGAAWTFDNPNGNPDSTAIGQWYYLDNTNIYSRKAVYALDLGMDEEGNFLGVMKIQMKDMPTSSTYKIYYASLDNSFTDSILIEKEPGMNYTFLTFNNGGKQLSLQPGKNSWDINFTQYTTTLYTTTGIPTPYLVLGILLNRYKVAATVIKDVEFEALNYADIQHLEFSNIPDYIGYQWKKYDFKNGYYEVNSNYTYILTDTEGYYYKVRFTGFYNNLGEKGYPTLEIQKL